MSASFKTAVVLTALALPLIAGVGDADAKRRPPLCQPTLEGSATSTGILGAGTAIARSAARAEWEQRAERFYGDRYANFVKARSVRWDCKKGAILLAKCVVTAKPCRG